MTGMNPSGLSCGVVALSAGVPGPSSSGIATVTGGSVTISFPDSVVTETATSAVPVPVSISAASVSITRFSIAPAEIANEEKPGVVAVKYTHPPIFTDYGGGELLPCSVVEAP